MNSEQLTVNSGEEYEVPVGHRSGFVTIVGRPNVGKSTLLNAFLGQKVAAVSPRPQTTRTRQLGIITEAEYQMIFIDTPGLIQVPRHKLDEFMRETAVETLADADVILWLVDGSEPPGYEDEAIAKQLTGLMKQAKVILGINKVDLLKAAQVIPHSEAYRALLPDAPWVLFSATSGNGRSELFNMLVQALPEGPRYYPAEQVTDVYVRDIAAELIREQILLQLRDEIPYGVVVEVMEFKERPNGSNYISANVYVERDSHKQIIIGAKGVQLKQIGEAARKEIENVVEGKVFLELWVKVEPKWRHSEQALKRFGYRKTAE